MFIFPTFGEPAGKTCIVVVGIEVDSDDELPNVAEADDPAPAFLDAEQHGK